MVDECAHWFPWCNEGCYRESKNAVGCSISEDERDYIADMKYDAMREQDMFDYKDNDDE
jgi:hypothetical protein